MNRTRNVVIALGLVAILGACGGGGNGVTGESTPTTTAKSPVETDRDRAARIVLTAADMPGYTVDHEDDEDDDDTGFDTEIDADSADCIDDGSVLSALDETDPRTVYGETFESEEGLQVSSLATVAADEIDAKAAMAWLRDPGVAECMSASMRSGFEMFIEEIKAFDPSARLVSAGATQLRISAGDEAAALRLAAIIQVGGERTGLTTDLILIRRERAVAVLAAGGETELPAVEQARLVATIADRMDPPLASAPSQ